MSYPQIPNNIKQVLMVIVTRDMQVQYAVHGCTGTCMQQVVNIPRKQMGQDWGWAGRDMGLFSSQLVVKITTNVGTNCAVGCMQVQNLL